MSCYPGEDGEEYIDGDTTEDEPLVEHQQNPTLDINKELPIITQCHSSDRPNSDSEYTDNFSPPIKKRKTDHVITIPSPENSFSDMDCILSSPFCDRERLIPSSEFLPRALNFYAIEGEDFSTDDNFLELSSLNFPEFCSGESLIGTTYQLSYDEVSRSSTTTRDPLESDNQTPNSWNFTESPWYDLSRFERLAQGGVCNGWWVE